MRKSMVWLFVLTALAGSMALAQELKTDDEKTVYALGQILGQRVMQSVKGFELSNEEMAIFKRALEEAIAGKESSVDLEVFGPKISALAQTRSTARSEKEKTKSQAFLAEQAKAPGAVKTESGLIFFDQKVGVGASPKATDTVKVNYRGTLIDGTEFDSSYKRNAPAEFPLNGVISCWTEGVQKMKVGGKAKLICPSAIAYGDSGAGSIPGGATLIFEVELLEIKAQETTAPEAKAPEAKAPEAKAPEAKPK